VRRYLLASIFGFAIGLVAFVANETFNWDCEWRIYVDVHPMANPFFSATQYLFARTAQDFPLYGPAHVLPPIVVSVLMLYIFDRRKGARADLP
jgi:hypothetical protein